ncbi:ankyrin repeat domain-containing protein [Polaromonas sp. LjRoot131]|uniref:ankyrin repeat domain-containing protein n=1 Tax=Polaromonas sp. LjRoot131 TaxID=3342262 RepID=UPI003ECD0A7C
MKNLIHYFKKAIYLLVIAGFSSASAGSYEDFFQAIKQDNAAFIQNLLQRGFDPNTVDPNGQTGLFIALQEPSLKAAEVLVNWPKTNVNTLNSKDESALMLAALKDHQELAEKLIKKGADVNKTGWAPLHYAATNGHLALISLLLENNAYIDAESPNGTTPLMMAAMYGTAAAVKLLLQEGADPQLKNQQGLTALQFAQRGNRPDSAEALAAAIRNKRPAGQW